MAIFESFSLSPGGLDDVAAPVRSHMNGLIRFERAIDQGTETTAANNEENYRLSRAVTLLEYLLNEISLSDVQLSTEGYW